MAVLWSNEKIMELIQLFRSKVILWDTSKKEYKDKNKKNDAFKEISRILSIPQKDVETKLHVLRTQFSREKKKMVAKRSLNIEGSEEKCKWIYYEPLNFLLRGPIISGDSDTSKKKRSEEIETVLCDSPHYEQRTEHDALDNEKQTTIKVSREFTPEKPTRKRKHHETVSSVNTTNVEKTFQDDDLTAFGNYIVSTLRKLSPRNCVAAQDDIFTVLSKYKLRQLADSEAMFSGTTLGPPVSKPESESPCTQDDG